MGKKPSQKYHTDNCTKPPSEKALASFESRFATFKNWRNSSLDPKLLAEAGFYYTNVSDVVKCPECKVEGYKWSKGDDPLADHIKFAKKQKKQCAFLKARSGHDDLPEAVEEIAYGRDTCGKYGLGLEPVPSTVQVNDKPLDLLEPLGVIKAKDPEHPEYISYIARLKSFEEWPKSLKQKPAELAEAGFFYSGVGDQTLCFQCGGGLKDWEENDQPWEQHAMWFSDCTYLLLKKGVRYVEKYKGMNAWGGEHKENGVEEARSEETKSTDDDSNLEKLCKICYKNDLEVLFLPCGHVASCIECSVALKACVICRAKIEATVRAFLP